MKKKLSNRNLLQEKLFLYPNKVFFSVPTKKKYHKQKTTRSYSEHNLLAIFFKRLVIYLENSDFHTLDRTFFRNI